MKTRQFPGLVGVVCALAMATHAHAATETILHTFGFFPNGAVPCGTLAMDSSTNLYGTTSEGGAYDLGTVFVREASGVYRVLHNFKGGTDGSSPYAGVVLDAAGNLYGTAPQGGPGNAGVVYKVTPLGQETILYSFTNGMDGSLPFGGVILDAAGNLYGTAYQGGASNAGVVYKVTPAGEEAVLCQDLLGAAHVYRRYGRSVSDCGACAWSRRHSVRDHQLRRPCWRGRGVQDHGAIGGTIVSVLHCISIQIAPNL